MYADRILKFGAKFQGRLDPIFLEGALDYIKRNEEGLAFELLCDYILEYDVSLSNHDYDEAIQLALDMGFDLKEGSFKHLKDLNP